MTGRADQPGTPERGAEELARAFEAQRPRLLRVAYATTGSLAEAEDCVQEAWLRLLRADGGGKVTATRRAARGADEVARWLLGFMRVPPTLVRLVTVNGGPGLVVRDGGGVLTVVSFTIDRGRITALDVIRNPDKLAAARELAD